MRVNVLVELSRLGMGTDVRDGKFRLSCPFHEDSTPSLDVFDATGRFHCLGCKKSGDFATLLARLEGKPRHIVEAGLLSRYGDDEKPIEPDQVERFHAEIWSCKSLLNSLAFRCITPEIIRRRRLGRDGDRITIPIIGPGGEYVNIRRYLPDKAPDDNRHKMTNMRGRGKRLRLYPFDQLCYKKIALWGGEMKALAAAEVLNPIGIGCVSLTGGEGDWSVSLEAFFEGKDVWVGNDIDQVGVKTTSLRCARLAIVAASVKPVYLPLDISEHPHGDVNDYLRVAGAEALVKVIEEAQEYEPDAIAASRSEYEELTMDPEHVPMQSLHDPNIVSRRIKCQVAVSALDQDVYFVPRKVHVRCSRDQDACAVCPVFVSAREPEFEISPESSSILAMIDSAKNGLREEVREALHIPPCKVVEFDIKQNFKVVEVRVQRTLNLTENSSDRTTMPAVVVNDAVELNETYDFTGRSLPHPKSQAATIIASKAEAVQDALSSYDPGDTDDLQMFRPAAWTTEHLDEHLGKIYEFLSRNVTRIYERESLHALVDLTFHSVLSMPLDGRAVKGVMEILVVGDSGQGKTEVTKNLCDWTGLGVRVDCKNATTAGLLGGLEQLNGKWFASWGVIPTHDRRLVVLEELKGLNQEVFSKLTDMRSSQVAEIPKIHKSRARARTRLIAVSNPARRNTTMDWYAFGVKAITELVPNPEDVRRFDACMVLNKTDVDPDLPNTVRSAIESMYDAEMARRLILWAWTRETDHVTFDPMSIELAFSTARRLCNTYTDSVPIFDRGSTRFKILKMAAACAARTFSTDDSGTELLVRPCHVEWVTKLLETEYGSDANGYLRMSEAILSKEGKLDAAEVNRMMSMVPNYKLLSKRMLSTHDMEMQDFCDWCSWSKEEAGLFVGALVRAMGLVREGKYYVKTPDLVQYLRKFDPKNIDAMVPAHIAADTQGEY